jgi:hypothetical protein
MPDRSLEFTPVDIEAAVANARTMFAWGEPRQCPNAERTSGRTLKMQEPNKSWPEVQPRQAKKLQVHPWISCEPQLFSFLCS